MKRILLLFSILFLVAGMSAQIPVGTFRDHLAYNSFHKVAAADDYIYAAGENCIMYCERKQLLSGVREGLKWSKCNGLSDVEIVDIAGLVKGASNGWMVSGVCNNPEFGDYTMCGDTDLPAFIVVRYPGNVLVFNLKTAEATSALFEEIKAGMPERPRRR